MARGVGDGSKSAANDLRQQLGTSLNAPGTSGVFRTLLTLLAEGMPVPKGAVARALGRPERDVVDLLAQIPSLEFDDAGDIVGAGLSLRPTMHLFEIGGRRLYTWCALDTLIFPAMLGRTERRRDRRVGARERDPLAASVRRARRPQRFLPGRELLPLSEFRRRMAPYASGSLGVAGRTGPFARTGPREAARGWRRSDVLLTKES